MDSIFVHKCDYHNWGSSGNANVDTCISVCTNVSECLDINMFNFSIVISACCVICGMLISLSWSWSQLIIVPLLPLKISLESINYWDLMKSTVLISNNVCEWAQRILGYNSVLGEHYISVSTEQDVSQLNAMYLFPLPPL